MISYRRKNSNWWPRNVFHFFAFEFRCLGVERKRSVFFFFLTCLWTDIDFRWAVCHSEDPTFILICEYLKRVSSLRDIAISSIVILSCFSISTEFGFHKGPFCCRIRLLRETIPIQISSQIEGGHFVFLDYYNMAAWLSGSGLAGFCTVKTYWLVVVFPNESSVSYFASETSVNTSVHNLYLHSYQLPFNGTWPVLLNRRQLCNQQPGDVYCWWCVLLVMRTAGDVYCSPYITAVIKSRR